MNLHIKAPDVDPLDYSPFTKIFLAGSIEMGAAEHWQERIVKELDGHIVSYNKEYNAVMSDTLFFNPRREDWDSSWDQKSAQFDEQVNWELDHLDLADIIVMYLDPSTKSPISLLELGLYASSGKLIVCCPDGFWRKGNVRIVCEKHKIPLFDNYEQWIEAIKEKLEQ
jgi:hypothetical protein